MTTESQIVTYLKTHIDASPKDIQEAIGVSRQMLHRILNKLLAAEMIEKVGRPPKVYYRLSESIKTDFTSEENEIGDEEKKFLEKHFNYFTETGNALKGIAAFSTWCNKQKLPLKKTVNEYIATRKKYLAYYGKNNVIEGTEKLQTTKGFDRICMDAIYYHDFYAIERFGKTYSGNLLHFAKQGQNKKLMQSICVSIAPNIQTIIKMHKVDAVGFIPPTIKRDVQIMRFLERELKLPLPHIQIKKVSGSIVVPQKALSKLPERITNARSSIIVDDKRKFHSILLIDDAIGSGATINETACKIKQKGITNTVIGFAVVGSYKGFDVIQEV